MCDRLIINAGKYDLFTRYCQTLFPDWSSSLNVYQKSKIIQGAHWSKALIITQPVNAKDCSLRMRTFQGGFSIVCVVPWASCWKEKFFYSYEKCGHYNSSLSFLCQFHAGFLSDLFWCHSLTWVYIFDFQEVKGSNVFLKVSSASDVCMCVCPCHVSVSVYLCLSVFVCVYLCLTVYVVCECMCFSFYFRLRRGSNCFD